MTRDDDDIRHESILDSHFSQFRNPQNIELPHLINKPTFAAETTDKEIIGLFGVFARVEVLVGNYHIENRIYFHIGRAEGGMKCGVLHGTENEITSEKLQ
jgi:hypothetical protein